MSRPVSWLPRLHEIRRSVAASVRSHYDRKDLEGLFELQPRAAQNLLGLMETVQIGTSRLVDRQVLASFLDRVHEAEDTQSLLRAVRSEKAHVSQRKVRSLVRRDLEPVSLDSLPDTMRISPGKLEIRFETVERLAESMLLLARLLESEGEEFARAYEPRTVVDDPGGDEVLALFSALDA